MKVYVAGPMTGLPDFNYPAFHQAAEKLRALGHHVENPAENVNESGDWSQWMRLAIAQLVTCDAVALLPGWGSSVGARLEHQIAILLGLDVRDAHEWGAA